VTRLIHSIFLASALTVVLAAAAGTMTVFGLPFTNTTVQLINLFLLVLVLVRKELDRRDIIGEVQEEKEIVKTLSRNYELLAARHREETQRTLQAVVQVAQDAAARTDPTPSGSMPIPKGLPAE
jgi:hypothetical protein